MHLLSETPMDEPLLAVKGVTKRFGGLVALRNVSFSVRKGEVIGLMGPNGAGKTTLLNVIAGEEAPDAGTVTFKGREITRLRPHEVCHLGMARTYQIPQPFVSLSVRDNLLVSAIFGRSIKKRIAGPEEERILDLVDLSDKKEALAGSLPILALKKLELARALAGNPDLILVDEVAAGSTEAEIPRILTLLKKIRGIGISVLLVEHVIKVMLHAVDRIVVIDKGVKIAEGEPQSIMNDRKVVDAYFGS